MFFFLLANLIQLLSICQKMSPYFFLSYLLKISFIIILYLFHCNYFYRNLKDSFFRKFPFNNVLLISYCYKVFIYLTLVVNLLNLYRQWFVSVCMYAYMYLDTFLSSFSLRGTYNKHYYTVMY